MRISIAFAMALVATSAQAQMIEYQFNNQSVLELMELPNGTVSGQVVVPDVSGFGQRAGWTVSGQRNAVGYDLDFLRTDSDLPSISGTFSATDLAGRPLITGRPNDTGGFLTPIETIGTDSNLSALIQQGGLNALLAAGELQAANASALERYGTWETVGAEAAVESFKDEFESLGYLKVLRGLNGTEKVLIIPGFEDLVNARAIERGISITFAPSTSPLPDDRRVLLFTREGRVLPRDVDPFDRQSVVKGRLSDVLVGMIDHFDLAGIAGTDFTLTLQGRGREFGFSGSRADLFFQFTLLVTIGVELGADPANMPDRIQIFFLGGESTTSTQEYPAVLNAGFQQLNGDQAREVPRLLLNHVAQHLVDILPATRGS